MRLCDYKLWQGVSRMSQVAIENEAFPFESLQFGLTQRTYNGQTILHSLVERNTIEFLLQCLPDILPVFQSAGNNINALDNKGYTVLNKLC